MREYYIRREGDEDAKGPYDIDQLSSLFEAGKVERDAYVYDIDQETWITIEECGELMKALFPEKKKLTLRSEESTPEDDDETSDESEEKKQSVSVSQMLAQA